MLASWRLSSTIGDPPPEGGKNTERIDTMEVKNKSMIKCKACGAEIAKSAKACPSCGAKQKRFHWWYILVGIVVIGIIGALGNKDDEPQKVGGASLSPSPSASVNASPTQPANETFGVGEQVSINDIVVTLTGVKNSAGSDFNKPKEGNVFVLCSFEIENNSSKDISVSSLMSFEAYVDGYSTNMSLGSQISSDAKQLDGSVAAGKKMAGAIGYELPEDWKELEITFIPDFWSGNDIVFIANNG